MNNLDPPPLLTLTLQQIEFLQGLLKVFFPNVSLNPSKTDQIILKILHFYSYEHNNGINTFITRLYETGNLLSHWSEFDKMILSLFKSL